jgi:hypothetical protein
MDSSTKKNKSVSEKIKYLVAAEPSKVELEPKSDGIPEKSQFSVSGLFSLKLIWVALDITMENII